MNKIWKLRWIISIILVIMTIIIVIFSIFNLLLLLIVPVIWTPSFFILEMMVIPKFREIEVEEKEKESKQKRYDPIKRIIVLLEGYEDIEYIEGGDNLRELEVIQELGELFPKLVVIGFRYRDDNTLYDNDFEIHVTNFPVIHQFLIRRLNLGREIGPNEVFYSRKYDFDSNVQVLNDFIDYLKKKVENR